MTNVNMYCFVLVIVLSALSKANPVPETSTARYSLGGYTPHAAYARLPQFPNSSQTNRNSKGPKNGTFYDEMVLKLIVEPRYHKNHSISTQIGTNKTLIKTKKVPINQHSAIITPNKIELNLVKVGTVRPLRVTPSPKIKVATTKIMLTRPTTTKSRIKLSSTSQSGVPFKIKLKAVSTTTSRPTMKVLLKKHQNRNYTTAKPMKKSKPTVRRVVTKWSEIKQNWYEDGVPYPNPMPEISSSSPPFSINDSPPLESLLEQAPVADSNNAISTFALDMAPGGDKAAAGGSPCPTVHISSSVLNPQQRQECSDLNLVINSHFHQSTATERAPTPTGQPFADDGIGQPLQGSIGQPLQGPVAADTPAAAAVGGVGGAGGTGGTGGNGGNGGNGNDGGGGLKFPDLKGLFEAIGYLYNGFGHLFGFLKNPYFYIIPVTLFFGLGFLAVLALFPWWIPFLFLYIGTKGSQKSNVTYYKHVHKPVHHPDGWFWNHETKTWQNLHQYGPHHHRRVGDLGGYSPVTEAIESFERKYGGDSPQSWKWRNR